VRHGFPDSVGLWLHKWDNETPFPVHCGGAAGRIDEGGYIIPERLSQEPIDMLKTMIASVYIANQRHE
jgi:hypothetical protein